MILEKIKKIHFVGIGGIGMSGLAEVMFRQGYTVTGSDRADNHQTAQLRKLGIRCYVGHEAQNVDCDLLVYTAAVHGDNPELTEAKRRTIPTIKRAALLGEYLRNKKGIAVAGTHGKTTTSAMIGMMLEHAGFDPAMFIGGVVNQLGSNAKISNSDWVVVEADEYDRSFLELRPYVAVINNIESDHLDIYRDMDDITVAFTQFADQASIFGCVLINYDDVTVKKILPNIHKRIITYGFDKEAMVRAENIIQKFGELTFNVISKNENLGTIKLKLSGEHNVKNALAAVGVGLYLGIDFKTIAAGLEAFRGTGRRFEMLGDRDGVTVIDDYAHHPTEIRATLRGAKSGAAQRRIIAVFQPHLFSRTRDYFSDFAKAFADADMVVLTEIYPAREEPIPGITGEKLFEEMVKYHPQAAFVGDRNHLADAIKKIVKPGDILLIMGAGDITSFGRQFVQAKA